MPHGPKILLAGFQTGSQVVDGAAGIFKVKSNILASGNVIFQLDIAIRPVIDFFDQALMNGGQSLIGLALTALLHFGVVCGHELV